MIGFRVEPLHDQHHRQAFACGVAPLERYLREQARQDVRKRAALCYVACEEEERARIAGFYTLSAGGVALGELPEAVAKRLPRYPLVPVARLGRLAVDLAYQGRKLGAALLWDALQRAARAEIAVFAMIVDAKDEAAVAFYRHHGFMAFGGDARQLMLPLANLR